MFSLTKEERNALTFLFILAFSGLGLSYFAKTSVRAQKLLYAPESLARININKTTMKELLDSRCVSKRLAQQILAYRQEYGEFSSIDDLKKVKGIGERSYEKLKDLFYLG
jgi:competence ComEA-like helix-hairpin-helix protein